MEQRQKSEAAGEGVFVYTRTGDYSVMARVSALIDKWKPLIYLGVLLLLAMGWEYISPSKKFEILAQKQTEIVGEQATMKATLAEVVKLNRVLVVGQCLDRPPRELALMGLDCSGIQQRSDSLRRR